MPRIPRRDIVEEGGLYHITARGNNQMDLFKDPEDFAFYKMLIGKAKIKEPALLRHYMLMTNHVHLEVCAGKNLSAFMRRIQYPYARRYAKKYGWKGHVWSGRFFSEPVLSDAHAFASGNYIEMNPVHAGMVNDPKDWPHSSYGYYAFGNKDELIDEDPIYVTLGETPEDRRKVYRHLVDKTRTK